MVRTPKEIAESALTIGVGKEALSRGQYGKLSVSSILAGAYIALGGVLSLIAGYGFPAVSSGNPSMQKLLSGAMFPIGLILVVILGAELFTGNNALLMPGLLKRRYSLQAVLKNWLLVYIGNFIGAMLVCYFLVYKTGLTAPEPWNGAIRNIAEAKVSMDFWTVFLKGIGANWCVCLAVWLALSGRRMIEKMAGCWLPVMAFVALGYEHSIANMFFIPCGMLEGADVTIGQMIVDNLIPATLGNVAGGALLVGCAHWYLYLRDR